MIVTIANVAYNIIEILKVNVRRRDKVQDERRICEFRRRVAAESIVAAEKVCRFWEFRHTSQTEHREIYCSFVLF